MAQFDVHRNPVGDMADAAPFVVDLQADHLAAIPRAVLIPPVASLADHRTDIIAALDFLSTGL